MLTGAPAEALSREEDLSGVVRLGIRAIAGGAPVALSPNGHAAVC